MPLVLNNDGNIEKKDDKHEFVKHAEAEKAHEILAKIQMFRNWSKTNLSYPEPA